MRCLLLTDATFPEGILTSSKPIKLQAALTQLNALSIKYDRLKVTNITVTEIMAAGYDFVLIPYVGGNYYKNLINNAALTIPVFILTVGNIAATDIGTTPGISGSITAGLDYFVDTVYSTSTFIASNARWWAKTADATALITASAVSPLTGSAQTDAGKISAWYTAKAGTGKLYCSSQEADGIMMMAFFLQVAYNNGDFTASQMGTLRKLPLSIDMDHVTGDSFTSLTILNRWLSLIPQGGVSWCGVTSGTGTSTNPAVGLTLSASTVGTGRTFTAASGTQFTSGDVGAQIWSGSGSAIITGYTSATVVTATITSAFAGTSISASLWGKTYYTNITNMAADVKAALQAAYAQGRIKFCYHEHSAGKECSTGDYPLTARGGTLVQDANVTKVQQDNNYRYLKGVWEAAGFVFDQPSFYVPATNTWNDDTLALMSPQTSLASSPTNASSIAGYGMTMVRMATGSNTPGKASRPCPFMNTNSRNCNSTRYYFAGMTFIPSYDLCAESYSGSVTTPTLAQWRSKWQYIAQMLHCGGSVYFHDEDFADTQAPATARFGVEVYGWLVSMSTYLKDVSVFWADQTKYSIGINP